MLKNSIRKFDFVIILLLLLTIQIGKAQQAKESIIDTLSFNEIYDIYLLDKDRYNTHIFPIHIQKAKQLKDTLQWAQAYRMKAWDSKMEEGLKYADTAFTIVQSIKRVKGKERRIDSLLGRTHITKAKIFYANDFNTEALKEFIKSYHFGLKAGDHDLVSSCIGAIADIKAYFGQENESLLLAKRNMLYTEEHRSLIPRYNQTKAHSLELLARTYLHLREIDSSQKYIANALKLSKKINTWRMDKNHCG